MLVERYGNAKYIHQSKVLGTDFDTLYFDNLETLVNMIDHKCY